MFFRFTVSLVLALCWPIMPAVCQKFPPPPNDVVSAAINSFSEYDSGTSADDIVALGGTAGLTESAPVIFARSADPDGHNSIYGAAGASYPSAHVVSLVGRSDFAGVGIPLARWTFPLPRHSFAVSIYLVEVGAIAVPGKDNYVTGAHIYIARAGGPFTVEGRFFRAINPQFQLFHLNEPYMFFGTRVANSLLKVDAEQVLKLDGVSLAEVSTKHQYQDFYKSRKSPDLFGEVAAATERLNVPNQGKK